MERLTLESSSYVCLHRPTPLLAVDVEKTLEAAFRARGRAPDLIYWNLRIEDGGALQEVAFGTGGLDPLLAQSVDLSRCVAVREERLVDLRQSGAISHRDDIGSALPKLLRSPTIDAMHCDTLYASASAASLAIQAPAHDRAVSVESLSVALISTDEDDDVLGALDSLPDQVITSKLEVLVVLSGSSTSSVKVRAQAVDEWSATHKWIRVRRFVLSGEFDRPYLANTAMALATGEIVVLAHPACRPTSPTALQELANWADGADIATATPLIETADGALAAGLSVTHNLDQLDEIAAQESHVLSDGARLCASPAPWLFACQRRNWIGSGGASPSTEALWTAAMAGERGPRGRHVLLGAARAQWIGAPPLREPVAVDQALRPGSASAILVVKTLQGSPGPTPARSDADARVAPSTRVASAKTMSPRHSFADESGDATARLRVLVFADAFGPSQSIAFIEGMREARRRGEVSVTVIAESDLEGVQSRDVGPAVGQAIETAAANVIVLSRLASPGMVGPILAAARERGIPVVAHLDDDLTEPPISLGIERYRLARRPGRVLALHEGLEQADVVLASTIALAERLAGRLSHRRIAIMPIGGGASPSALRSENRSDDISIGYMASASHDRDLAMIVPALNRVLAGHPNATLTLFGSIAKQPSAKALRGNVISEPGVFGNYSAFRARLADLSFDVGLAPLIDREFNRMKTPIKWIEYAEAGAAVLASKTHPYRSLADSGALVAVSDDGWEQGLGRLLNDHRLRERLRENADRLLRSRFGWDRLEAGMLRLLYGLDSQAMAAG